jgi:hypothetical protein
LKVNFTICHTVAPKNKKNKINEGQTHKKVGLMEGFPEKNQTDEGKTPKTQK